MFDRLKNLFKVETRTTTSKGTTSETTTVAVEDDWIGDAANTNFKTVDTMVSNQHTTYITSSIDLDLEMLQQRAISNVINDITFLQQAAKQKALQGIEEEKQG